MSCSMGADQAVVLGRSGVAIIGLELVATKPVLIDFLIVHEAPVIRAFARLRCTKMAHIY